MAYMDVRRFHSDLGRQPDKKAIRWSMIKVIHCCSRINRVQIAEFVRREVGVLPDYISVPRRGLICLRFKDSRGAVLCKQDLSGKRFPFSKVGVQVEDWNQEKRMEMLWYNKTTCIRIHGLKTGVNSVAIKQEIVECIEQKANIRISDNSIYLYDLCKFKNRGHAMVECPSNTAAKKVVQKLTMTTIGGATVWVQMDCNAKGSARYLVISNLQRRVDEVDIEDALKEIDGVSKPLVTDFRKGTGKETGCAIIECASKYDAEKVGEHLNDYKLKYRRISVQWLREGSSCTKCGKWDHIAMMCPQFEIARRRRERLTTSASIFKNKIMLKKLEMEDDTPALDKLNTKLAKFTVTGPSGPYGL